MFLIELLHQIFFAFEFFSNLLESTVTENHHDLVQISKEFMVSFQKAVRLVSTCMILKEVFELVQFQTQVLSIYFLVGFYLVEMRFNLLDGFNNETDIGGNKVNILNHWRNKREVLDFRVYSLVFLNDVECIYHSKGLSFLNTCE